VRLVADEGVDAAIVRQLRAENHEVLYVAELVPGIDDQEILDLANRRDALLVTDDKDFGELVYRQGLTTAGVLLVRLAGLSSDKKADLVASSVRRHHGEMYEAFSVLTPARLRIRSPAPAD
jgi:predicted nuclease of predicted toxin-antitoxin system